MRTELIGREQEFATLTGWLESALEGNPRLGLCAGEPGIGKTRLAEELSGLARARGVVTLWGMGVESAGAPPYWPWRQVLRALSAVVDLTAIAQVHRLTIDLALLAPDVFAGAVDTGSEPVSMEDRFRQFDAVGLLLRHVTATQPLLIVLDDAHWADNSSLLLLQHIARVVTGERLLLLVNYRDTEQLHAVLATELMREPVVGQIHLSGLAAAAVGRQLDLMIGRDVPDAEVDRVHALTGGNPFFVGEVGRMLAGRPAGAALPPVTANVRDAIGARLIRLSPDCVRLLRAASIVGLEFSVNVAAALLNTPVLGCLGPLDEAVAAGLVEPTATPGVQRFAHALVRDAIEAGLGMADRVRLHRLAAEAIEELYAGSMESHVADLARHWAVAAVQGDRHVAVRWIERAAQEAMRRLAYEEGVRLFRLGLTVGASDLDATDRCRLLLALARALHLSADAPGRIDACREAATLARSLGRPDLLAEAALATEGVGPTEYDLTARRLCEEALAAQDVESTALRARLSASLSGLCMYLGDLDAAGSASEQALRFAHRSTDLAAEVAALRARQLVCSGPDGLAERERLADHMLAIGRASGNAATQMWAHLWRIDTSLQRGDLARVARVVEDLARCTDEVRGSVARWQLLRCRAALAQAQARFDVARRLADEAFRRLPASAHPAIVRDGLLTTMGHQCGHGCDAGESGSLLASGLADAAADLPEYTTGDAIMSIAPAFLLAEAGRLADAAAIYRRLGPVTGWRPMPHVVTVCYAFGIQVAIALNVSADVATLRELLGNFRGQHVASGGGAVAYGGPVELYLGMAAGHLGRVDEAIAEFEHAAKVCAANGAAGFHVESQYELAVVLAGRARPGDLARSRALAAESARQASVLGMPPFTAKARRLIAELSRGTSEPLTPREREVADLVAQGLTNREVAARLYLSERTAQNHVQHILTKLDLPNRSQIAVWVTTRR